MPPAHGGVDPDERRLGSEDGFVRGGVEFGIGYRFGRVARCVWEVLVDLPGLWHLFIYRCKLTRFLSVYLLVCFVLFFKKNPRRVLLKVRAEVTNTLKGGMGISYIIAFFQ